MAHARRGARTAEVLLDSSCQDSIDGFSRRNDGVIATVPAHRLLVVRVQDGWKPLCDFLAVPEPEEPFPHGNDAAEFMTAIDREP